MLPIAGGISALGTGLACTIAARRPVDLLILEAPPTDAADAIAAWNRALRWYLRFWLTLRPEPALRDFTGYPAQLAPTIHAPLLVLHGDRDAVIPPALGHRVHDLAASVDKRFVSVPGAGHNDLRIDQPPVLDALRSAIDAACTR